MSIRSPKGMSTKTKRRYLRDMAGKDLFYVCVESVVRKYVRILRNAGINTEGSCHHEGYIECQVLDIENDIKAIQHAFMGKLDKYVIEYQYVQTGEHTFKENLVITSNRFKLESKSIN